MDERRTAVLEETRAFWQSRTSRVLTQEDARQAMENLNGFFTTLQRWAAAESTGAEPRETAEAA